MSCFGCSRKYGLFCKEHGCPNCGYSYCAKCLRRPMPVPRHGGKMLNVCLICCDKLSKNNASEKVIDCDALPGTLVTKGAISKKKPASDTFVAATVALLEDDPPANLGEVLAPITSAASNANATIESTHSNDENVDIADNLDSVISKRLKDLKTFEIPTTSTEGDIRARLSNLTGMPQKDYSKKDLLLATDERTDQEKMRDLLEQFMGEAQLNKKLDDELTDAITDIERRLRALRGTEVDGATGACGSSMAFKDPPPETNTPSDNEDDETVLKSVMQKYLAEAHLPSADNRELDDGISPLPSNTRDLEELPWCSICNEDATVRCKGCDGELFCAGCFRECHDDDEEYRLHEKVSYSAPPKFKENHF